MYVYYQGRLYEKALMACNEHKNDPKSVLPGVAVILPKQEPVQESQEKMWDEIEHIFTLYGGNTLDRVIRELKSRFTLTRNT